MANSLLDLYGLPKRREGVTFPERNAALSFIKDGTPPTPQVEPVSSSDDVVAQTVAANANAPAKVVPDFTDALPTPLSQPPVKNVIAKPSAPVTAPYVPQTEYEKYWKTPVGTDKYNMPLDQFVKVAGLAAKALNPQNPIANDLIKMGGEAYNERARREYEGPNVLLQRRLHETQLKAAESVLEGQNKMSEFVTTWPERELTLKQKGMTQESIDNEFVAGMIKTIAPYAPEKAAALQERAIEARANKKLREYAQDMKDYFNELKVDRAIEAGERAERTAAERKRHNEIMEKFRGEEIGIKKTKAKEDKTDSWYPFGTDPATHKIIYTNKKGESKLGDLPPEVKSIAPKTEKPKTEKQKFDEVAYGKLRLGVINAERRKKGLPALTELPPEESKGKKKAASTAITEYPEGTIIKNSSGVRKVMRNGQWVDMMQGEQ